MTASRSPAGPLAAVILLAVLSSCVPWTVRPIEKGGDAERANGPFNATAYVDSIWDSKVLPTVREHSVDVAEFIKTDGGHSTPERASVLVKGAGRVAALDTTTRTRLALIDLAPFDGKPDVAVQIGPVIRGSALRDALPFIQFSQFVNQLQFAAVSNALNERVLKTVLAPVSEKLAVGVAVTFSGAATLPEGGGLPEIVPITIEAGGERG